MADFAHIEETGSRRDESDATNAGRTMILSAAHQAICAVGYPGLTVEEVRRRAGVSKATFYFYFKNKQHLFIQVVRSVMDEMFEVAGRHYPDRDEFTRIVFANANYLDIWRREHRILGHFFAAALTDPDMGRIYADYRSKFESRIAGRIELLMDQGRADAVSPELMAATLSSMVEFTAFRYFFINDPAVACHGFAEIVEILSKSWFRAVYAREAPAGFAYAEAIESALGPQPATTLDGGASPLVHASAAPKRT